MTTIISQPELEKFVAYVFSFYRPNGGLYPIKGLSLEMVEAACYAVSLTDFYGDGDSVDRERVRDLIKSLYGLSH